MKLSELELEESKAIFYFGMGALIMIFIKMLGFFSDWILIILSLIVMFGAWLLDEAEKKIKFMDSIRRKNS